MTMYAIPPLTIEQLNALQNAIVAGAFSLPLQGLYLALEDQKGNSHAQSAILKDIDALKDAGRAVMNACPVGQTVGDKAVQAARNMCACHHVYGYNTPEFQRYYIQLAKEVKYNWELLESDMPPAAAERGRSLT